MAAAVSGLSPVIITVLMPILRKLGKALLDATLDDILEMDDTQRLAVAGYDQRCAAGAGDGIHSGLQVRRNGMTVRPDQRHHRIGCTLAY